MERLEIVNRELLSEESVKAKIQENENYLLEAIKNEFSIPSLKLRLDADILMIEDKIKNLDKSNEEMYQSQLASLIGGLKQTKEKKMELDTELQYNQNNIEVYQKYLSYLYGLLNK